MRDSIHDDLDMFESMPTSSKSMSLLDELEEYEPRLPKKLSPVEDFSFLLPEETKPATTHEYFSIIDEPETMLDIFDELEALSTPTPTPTPTHTVAKLPVHVRPVKDIITPEMRVFLMHYMGSGTVTTALRNSKTSLARYKHWLADSPKFTQALVDSTEALADRLETEALKQALSGNTKVLLKSLEALRPGKWGRSSTVNTFLDGKLKVEVTNWADLVQKADVVDITPTLVEGEVD